MNTKIDVLHDDITTVQVFWKRGKDPKDNARLCTELGRFGLVQPTFGEQSLVLVLDPDSAIEEVYNTIRSYGYELSVSLLQD
jgi:hypothetical protein